MLLEGKKKLEKVLLKCSGLYEPTSDIFLKV